MLLGFKTLDPAAGGKLGGLRVRAVFSFLFLTLVLFFERGRVTGVFKAQVCSLARPSWDLMNCKQSSLGPFPLLDEAWGPGCGARAGSSAPGKSGADVWEGPVPGLPVLPCLGTSCYQSTCLGGEVAWWFCELPRE